MSKNNFLSTLILSLLSTAFVLVDWSIGIISFSDILILLAAGNVLILHLKSGNIYIQKNQLLFLVGLVLVVSLNILLNVLLNSDFHVNESLISLAKVCSYSVIFILMYNFLRKQNVEYRLLQILNITALIVCIIGIYITISIYLNGVFPYEFFWSFTRVDIESYTYSWNRNIIRTRSLFAEPAHLGFYLNAVSAVTYFNGQKYKINNTVDKIITITTFITFSYSSIFILTLLKLLKYMNPANLVPLFSKVRNIFAIIATVIVLLSTLGIIQETVLIRTQDILNGEDSSAVSRIEGSWSYVTKENFFIGNGIGNTPNVFNNYAYILSDLGFACFLFFVVLSLILLTINFKLGIVFVALNFQKGGYLGVGYWIFVLLIILYMKKSNNPK